MELPWKGRSEVTVGGCPEGAATYGIPSPSLSRPGGAARIPCTKKGVLERRSPRAQLDLESMRSMKLWNGCGIMMNFLFK